MTVKLWIVKVYQPYDSMRTSKHTYHSEDPAWLPGHFCLFFCNITAASSILIGEGFGRVTLNVLFRTECLKNGLSYGESNKRITCFNYIIHKHNNYTTHNLKTIFL